MEWIEKEVFLVKEVFLLWQMPGAVTQYFLHFYIPLRNAVCGSLLIQTISTAKGKRGKLLDLKNHPYKVFHPWIVDDRILKFAELVCEKKNSFTYREVSEDLKPLLMKAIESGSGCAFQLLCSYRLLPKDSRSAHIFITRCYDKINDQNTIQWLCRHCVEHNMEELFMPWMRKLKERQLLSEEYLLPGISPRDGDYWRFQKMLEKLNEVDEK